MRPILIGKTKLISASARIFNTAHRLGWCESIMPVITVNEFPKSGGTWVAKLVASAVDLPFIDSTTLPPGCPCVIRNHWNPKKIRLPAIFVVRDSRDVMVSLFHHRIRNKEKTKALNEEYRKVLGEDLCLSKIQSQMAGFVGVESEYKGYGNYLGWANHVKFSLQAIQKDNRSVLVKYEDMLENPIDVLDETVTKISGMKVSRDKLELVVKLFSIDLVKKNQPISSNQTTFVRAGVAGGWRDSFSTDAEEILSLKSGEVMRELGYL